MFPRPRFRLPLWAAAVIVAAVYLIRSLMRGMDFRLEWPADAVALGLFAAVLVMVAYIRKVVARGDDADAGPDSENDEDPPAR
jgi:hypothetical protein